MNYLKEQQYLKAKKRVKDIKGFYAHLSAYMVVNIFLSGLIIYGLTRDDSIRDALNNFGVYATWIFWGIGLCFHWLGVFGFSTILGKKWEENKIKELMNQEEQLSNQIFNKSNDEN